LNSLEPSKKEVAQVSFKDKAKKSAKDFIIPHDGNNFLPKILHPNRILFYTVTAVFIKMLVLLFVLFHPIDAFLTPDMAALQSNQLLQLTNKFRQEKGLPPLKENDKLKKAANLKSADMINAQYFNHISPQNRGLSDWLGLAGYKFKVAGENLAMGFDSAEDIFKSWQNSPTHYANLVDPDFQEIGISVSSGLLSGNETSIATQVMATLNSENQPEQNIVAAAPKINKKQIVLKNNIKKINQNKTLSRPTISLPEKKIAKTNSQTTLKIITPQADYLDTFIDGELVERKKSPSGGNINQEINLPEGVHDLAVAVTKGDERIFSPNYSVIVNNKPLAVDKNKSKIIVSKSKINENITTIKASVILSSDTEKAWLQYDKEKIELQKNNNEWVGQGIISDINKPIIMGTVISEDGSGAQLSTDIGIDNIYPHQAGLFNWELFSQDHQPEYLQGIFNITSAYYKLLLLLSMLALFINIVFEIKKQHHHVLLSTSGLIIILLLLIIV